MGLLGTIGGLAGSYFGGPIGGTLGGLVGGALDGNQNTNGGAGAQSSSSTRDPWAAAQPYLRQNLQNNANLQAFYQQNPFNQQQKTGYQNQNNLIDQFNGQVAPGLLSMANGLTTQTYQRARGGAPGSGAGYGGTPQAAGNVQGLLSGPFSMPQQQALGQIDWGAMNPYSQQNQAIMSNKAPIPQTEDNFDPQAYLAANPDVAAP